MGLVIVAGMSIGTIFTLFVVPMFYTFISSRTRRADRRRGEGDSAGGARGTRGPSPLPAE